MSILDLFRKNRDEVPGTKVLVCALDNRFDDLANKDAEIYGRYYKATTTIIFPSLQALLKQLEQNFDIVHVICDVTPNGTISDTAGKEMSGTELIQHCCDHNVKLLWCASDNPAERYIKGFGARGKRLNLVMTLARKGSSFSIALEKLLSQMAYGETMPNAWSNLWPQIPGAPHPDAPESIFLAGRGSVKLLA
jgi:hypothetical protein